MLAYFPVPYEDELFYSCIARYAVHTGRNSSQKAVVQDMFNTSTAVAVPDLPSHLDAFVRNVHPVWQASVEELVAKYTLAPIYLPFLSQQQARQILTSMASSDGSGIYTRTGISAGNIRPSTCFRYCPQCASEQESDLGELYWRRAHQLPGMEFCLHHGCILEGTTVYYHPREKHHFHPAAFKCRHQQAAQAIVLKRQEKCLAKWYLELLSNPCLKGLGHNRWTLFYQELAHTLGVTHKRRVMHPEIHRRLVETWSGTSFEQFLVGNKESHWLTQLFRKHRKSFHPIQHLMALVALVPEKNMSEVLSRVKRLPATVTRTPMSSREPQALIHKVDEYRRSWMSLLAKNSVGVNELRTLPGGARLYTWLYRHDYEWLMSHRPMYKQKPLRRYRADYEAWDQDNLNILEAMYVEHSASIKRPRMSRTWLIKTLPRANSLEKHLNDLPLTRQWLALHAETLEDHRIFRLQAAYQHLVENNIEVKRWRLLIGARIRKELITHKIDIEINRLVTIGRWRNHE